jgi:hypothetical protein
MANNFELELESLDIEVSIKLANGKVHKFNVQDELEIDRDYLNDGYIDQSGKYAWWGMVLEVAKMNVEQSKANLELIESEADERVRAELDMEGVKITEALVNRKIKADTEYKTAQKALFKAKKNAGVLDKVLKAFDHRMESLISLGANIRKEENNVELTLKKEMAKQKTVKKNK